MASNNVQSENLSDNALQKVRDTLRKESKNRVLDTDELDLYECLAKSIKALIPTIKDLKMQYTMRTFEKPANLKNAVGSLLENQKTVFRDTGVLSLLLEELPFEHTQEEQFKIFYCNLTADCKGREIPQKLMTLCLYLAATCINVPIYVMRDNQQWYFYQPLFEYENQLMCCMNYLTLYASPNDKFHTIESTDINAPPPKAIGLVGMYKESLEEIPLDDITVPEKLKKVTQQSKSELCFSLDDIVIKEYCDILVQKRLATKEQVSSITARRANRDNRAELVKLVWEKPDAFIILCRVLMKRKARQQLEQLINSVGKGSWRLLVDSCDYLKRIEALCELDEALYARNICVTKYIQSCKRGEIEIDERRKNVNIALMTGSSVGILSGGLVIAGFLLAPVSAGASLGLSIAGGAIGVGSGVSSGVAKAVEVVKQKLTFEDLENIKQAMVQGEQRFFLAYHTVAHLFRNDNNWIESSNEYQLDVGSKGLQAIGGAAQGGLAIGFASVLLGAPAAAVLGPVSIVFDVAFLIAAAVNRGRGNKTDAGIILRNTTKVSSAKDRILNSLMRGNFAVHKRMIVWTE